MKLFYGDCLEVMQKLEDNCVDMILCDPPYGITNADWDIRLPTEEFFAACKRVIKSNGAIVLFSTLPYAVDMINGNRKEFRYEIIWKKTLPVGFLNAAKRPLRIHENILVFYKKQPIYNPQKWKRTDANVRLGEIRNRPVNSDNGELYGKISRGYKSIDDGMRFPIDVIEFKNTHGNTLEKNAPEGRKHPTSKPVALLEWLIKSYTNEGDTVLDPCMGGGSSGVAALTTGRNFIGIEKNEHWYNASMERIEIAKSNIKAPLCSI